jgi:hypothetical protein
MEPWYTKSLKHGPCTYFVQAETGQIKIGRSHASSMLGHLSSLRGHSPVELRLLVVIEGDAEEWYHERHHESRLHGEWFRPSEALLEDIRLLLCGDGPANVPVAHKVMAEIRGAEARKARKIDVGNEWPRRRDV